MKLDITQVTVRVGDVEDQPGQLAATLDTLQAAGINLEFGIARHCPANPATVSSLSLPSKARKNNCRRGRRLLPDQLTPHPVRVEAKDREGLVLL